MSLAEKFKKFIFAGDVGEIHVHAPSSEDALEEVEKITQEHGFKKVDSLTKSRRPIGRCKGNQRVERFKRDVRERKEKKYASRMMQL